MAELKMSQHTKTTSVTDAIPQYTELQPTYEHFSKRLKDLFYDLLQKNGVKFHVLEHRSKSVQSFKEKIERAGKNYTDPLKQLTDLAGIRIIVYYQDDVDRVCSLISSEFNIDENASVDKREELDHDQFGYSSVHLIVSLKDPRKDLAEWQVFNKFCAEIQVRTVLQHAWASISHGLQYKRESDIPASFRRRLVRLAGIFELADDEFLGLRKQQNKFLKNVTEQLSKSDLNVELNSLSVTEYLRASELPARVLMSAQKAGLGHAGYQFPSDDNIIEVARPLKIETLSQLDTNLKKAVQKADSFFEHFSHSFEDGLPFGGAEHWCAVLLAAANHKTLSPRRLAYHVSWYLEYRNTIINSGKHVW